MKEFNVGDEVYCLGGGNGVVIGINKSHCMPVNVKFSGGSTNTYTLDGKIYQNDINKILYFGHDLIVTVSEPQYEWQVTYALNSKHYMSDAFYKSVDDFIKNVTPNMRAEPQIFEPSKRLVKG